MTDIIETDTNGDRSVEDAEDRFKRKRLDDIHEAKKRVHETLNEVETARVQGKLSDDDANTIIRRAVEAFVRQMRYQLQNTDTGDEYWTNIEIGTVTIDPPPVSKIAWQHKQHHDIGTEPHHPDYASLPPEYTLRGDANFAPRRYDLVGLDSLFRAPNPFQEQFRLQFHIRFRGTETVTHTKSMQLPKALLLEYFDAAIDAAGEIGLDAQVSPEDDDAGWDVEDYRED